MAKVPGWVLAMFGVHNMSATATAPPAEKTTLPTITTTTNTTSTLSWGNCPTGYPINLQCSNLTVPLDWEFPDKGTTYVGIARYKSQNQTNWIGNLVVQPGGPGGSSAGLVSDFGLTNGKSIASDAIRESFDIIGIDVRGTGLSDPLVCSLDLHNARRPDFPVTQSEYDEAFALNKAYRASCVSMSSNPALLDYMDSVSIAKDYEAVRIALGAEPWTYYGASYGTQLGTQYAELFPNSLRGMVLDGVVGDSATQIDSLVETAASVEAAFRSFMTWCSAQNATVCPAAHNSVNKSLETVWLDTLASADAEPLLCDAASCLRPNITKDELQSDAVSYLYDEGSWPLLSLAMVEAYAEGNATLFGLNAPNALPALEANSELFSHVAILCSDWPHSNLTLADVQLRNRLVQTIAPLTGGKSVPSFVQIHCLGWPADVRNPPHHVSIPAWGVNLPTIMLVSSFFDPASSPVWAAQVQADIGEDRAVLVTRNHTGHVQYGQTDGRGGATSTAIENYLLKLEVPQNGQVYQS